MMNAVLVVTLAALFCLVVVSEPPPKKLFFTGEYGTECDGTPCALAIYERFPVPDDSNEGTKVIDRITSIDQTCDCPHGTACTLMKPSRQIQRLLHRLYYDCQPVESHCNLKDETTGRGIIY